MNSEHSKTHDTLYGVDPTSYSLLTIPDGISGYKRKKYLREEVFCSLLFKGILNFCDILVDMEWNAVSIPMNPQFVDEKLELTQIIADIALIEVLTGNTWDRSVIPQYDHRNQQEHAIMGNNCCIFYEGTYSVFDIDDANFRFLRVEDILWEFLRSIQNLYSVHDLPGAPFSLVELEVTGIVFGNRIVDRVSRLLERYDNLEWKKLFFEQRLYVSYKGKKTLEKTLNIHEWKDDIWSDEDREMYERFIRLLRIIRDIFSQNNRALSEYIETNRSVLLGEIVFNCKTLWSLVKMAISRILP